MCMWWFVSWYGIISNGWGTLWSSWRGNPRPHLEPLKLIFPSATSTIHCVWNYINVNTYASPHSIIYVYTYTSYIIYSLFIWFISSFICLRIYVVCLFICVLILILGRHVRFGVRMFEWHERMATHHERMRSSWNGFWWFLCVGVKDRPLHGPEHSVIFK